MDEMSARLAVLRARAQKLKAEAKIEFTKTLEVLQNKQIDARARLIALRHSGEEAWGDLKQGLEKARTELKTALAAAAERFD